jgi:hypothetical protein
MSIFSSILGKLGFGSAQAATPAPTTPVAHTAPIIEDVHMPPPPPAVPVAISDVDVVAKLTSLAEAHTEKLNWKTSIVDLLKLLDIESSLSARKELATELGCPADKMADSANMNIWLHKTVLSKIAANGGNVPKELLD